MMFVFGEVSDAIQETTMLVEDIVRSQVIEIVRLSSIHLARHLQASLSMAKYCENERRTSNAPLIFDLKYY